MILPTRNITATTILGTILRLLIVVTNRLLLKLLQSLQDFGTASPIFSLVIIINE